MGYPKRCPRCDELYAPPFEGTATVERRAGGAADPLLPGRPGAVLHLSCRHCQALYWWDFFAASVVTEIKAP